LKLFLATLTLVVLPIFPQNVTGTISGIVHDPSGAVVPLVNITATNTGTSAAFKTTTDETGAYFLRTLPVGFTIWPRR